MSNLKRDLEDFKNTPEGFKKLLHPWALKVLYPCTITIVVLMFLFATGGNNSKKLVSPIGKSKAEVATCLGFLTEVNRVEGNLKNAQNKFIEIHKPFLSRIETILNKIRKEPWVNNQRVENVKNLMSNYSEIEKELYYNLVVGQNMYIKLNTTQKGVMRLNCSVLD
tara:strand:+ start:295 stop:792 length:498 start_codon:yes stop_codon:yes gene_type:complete